MISLSHLEHHTPMAFEEVINFDQVAGYKVNKLKMQPLSINGVSVQLLDLDRKLV